MPDDDRESQTKDEQTGEELNPGLYRVDDDGTYTELSEGTYTVDEDGRIEQGVHLQPIVDKFPWDKIPEMVAAWSKAGSTDRRINVIGMYLLTALIIAAATGLSYVRIIEGQAIVAFLGAAIGYLLSRGRL